MSKVKLYFMDNCRLYFRKFLLINFSLTLLAFFCLSSCRTPKATGCATFDSKELRKGRAKNRGKALSTPKWNKSSGRKMNKRKAKKSQKDLTSTQNFIHI